MFYKYCRLLGVIAQSTAVEKHGVLESSSALEGLHMDITMFKTADGVKHYLYYL